MKVICVFKKTNRGELRRHLCFELRYGIYFTHETESILLKEKTEFIEPQLL